MFTHVLDKGYVRLIDSFGNDLSVVNAARVSFDKSSDEMNHRNERLIEYLVEHRHDSVLRHCAMTLEVYAPLFVARQWWKHHVGSTFVDDQNGWNESSRRYVTEEPQFYIPGEWRGVAENKKQGSSDPVDEYISYKYNHLLESAINKGLSDYEEAMKDGIAVEQARLLLPAYAMYVRWRWTASLNALLHFISLRLGHDAQWEITQYAQTVYDMVHEKFPVTVYAWEKCRV